MRTIAKNPNPPLCLAHQPDEQDWGDFIRLHPDCIQDIAEFLLREQHFLCCYCESETRTTDKAHIEHLFPRNPRPPLQNRNPCRTYDYNNLASSCNVSNHCGTFKENNYDTRLFSSPHNPATVRLLRYGTDGRVEPDRGINEHERLQAEYLISLLNLNSTILVSRRNRHARQITDSIGSPPDEENLHILQQHYLEVDGNGALKQFHTLSMTILGNE